MFVHRTRKLPPLSPVDLTPLPMGIGDGSGIKTLIGGSYDMRYRC